MVFITGYCLITTFIKNLSIIIDLHFFDLSIFSFFVIKIHDEASSCNLSILILGLGCDCSVVYLFLSSK